MQDCQESAAEEQRTLCKMAYSEEKHVFIVKTFYQTRIFVTVQIVSEDIQQVIGNSKTSIWYRSMN
jgi:hypothetical protein